MLKKYCKCGKLIAYGMKLCDDCKQKSIDKQSIQRSRKKYDEKRKDDKYTKFYNSTAWRKLSAGYSAQMKYKCERCGYIATEVHHKRPLRDSEENWAKRFEIGGLELLCKDCHNAEHKRFGKNR